MTHRDVIPLLPDLMEARLDEGLAGPAWAHVAACVECRQAITAMYQVGRAVADVGAAVFATHPSSHDLVRFALVDPDLTTPELARLGDHVRGCDECRDAVALTRDAERATARGGFARLLDAPVVRRAAALAPALAAVAILAYPAWMGLARYPEAARAHRESAARVATLESTQRELSAALDARTRADASAGPARLLYLPGAVRGTEPAVEVALDPAQRWQPIVIQHRPFEGAPRGTVEIRIGPAGEAPAWRESRDAAAFWDPEHEALVALVPASALRTGVSRLEVRHDGTLTYAAEFRVRSRNP